MLDLWSCAQVCERRLELRQKRPQAEMFKDVSVQAMKTLVKLLACLRSTDIF